jgi:hypothetical protein
MSLTKKILLGLIILFIVIQLIRPTHNMTNQVQQGDIGRQFAVPEHVQNILKRSCYDCHSNNTRYPWYAHIQPAGWYLAHHVKEGKAELNFNEFAHYSRRRQLSKFKSIAGSIKDGTMPLSSYTLLHRDAQLSAEEKELLINWASKTRDSLLAARNRNE